MMNHVGGQRQCLLCIYSKQAEPVPLTHLRMPRQVTHAQATETNVHSLADAYGFPYAFVFNGQIQALDNRVARVPAPLVTLHAGLKLSVRHEDLR